MLAARKSTRLVPPTLEFLNSVVDSDSDIDFETENTLRGFVNFLGQIFTRRKLIKDLQNSSTVY